MTCLALACALWLSPAAACADTLVVTLSGRIASQSLGRLERRDTLLVSGQMPKPSGEVVHSVRFGVSSTKLRAKIAWVSGATGADVRLVGVNVDLLNGAGMTVATDTVSAVTSGVAVSTIEFDSLVPDAAYTLPLTGAQLSVGAHLII